MMNDYLAERAFSRKLEEEADSLGIEVSEIPTPFRPSQSRRRADAYTSDICCHVGAWIVHGFCGIRSAGSY